MEYIPTDYEEYKIYYRLKYARLSIDNDAGLISDDDYKIEIDIIKNKLEELKALQSSPPTQS